MKEGSLAYCLEPNQVSSDVIRDVYGVDARILEDAESGIKFVLPYSISRL